MGSISVNKLGGLSLIAGPTVALVGFFLRPGGGLIGGIVDPANAQASIGVALQNSSVATLSSAMVIIGLIAFMFGLSVLSESLKGGSGEAIARLGQLFIFMGIIMWVVSSINGLVIAGGSATAVAGSIYATAVGLNTGGGVLSGIGFTALALAVSTRADFNKSFALVVAVTSLGLVGLNVAGALDSSLLNIASQISGLGYLVTIIWGITIGLRLSKEG